MIGVPIEDLHLGMLFGVRSTPHLVGKVRVLLDGEDVTGRAREGCVGEEGWVEVYKLNEQGRPYVDQGEVAMEVLSGRVELEMKEDVPS